MRVTADTQRLALAPGASGTITLDVANTAHVIDGITARIHGFPAENVSSRPQILPLFPDASGSLTLTIAVPPTYPAGRHALRIELMSSDPSRRSYHMDFELVVGTSSAVAVEMRPKIVRTRRVGHFAAFVTNTGNIALDVVLKAVDADRSVSVVLTPDTVHVPAGSVSVVDLEVTAPRMIFGAERDRSFTVEVAGRSLDLPPRAPAALPGSVAEDPRTARTAEIPKVYADLARDQQPSTQLVPRPSAPLAEQMNALEVASVPAAASAVAMLRQRPVISRGMLTALILPAIIALWAAVFLIGLNQVFSGDPLTKTAPASFYASLDQGLGAPTLNPDGTTASPGVPVNALPKQGQVGAGVGGTISGKVIAASDGSAVGRLQVEALRRNVDGNLVTASSGATQADGTYTVAGLFPGDYLLRVSATGYTTVWYGNVATDSAAKTISTSATKPAAKINLTIAGLPAGITGTVNVGTVQTPVSVTVQARPISGSADSVPVAEAKTAADGSYALANLPAPGKYTLSFSATGYGPASVVESVSGGQSRIEPAVILSAGNGQISGLVTDGANPLGGVTVSTVVNGQTITTGTPTTGSVGRFVLSGLPTPNTYVVTFTLAGYGQKTVSVDLDPGASRTDLNTVIQVGTGAVTGRVVDQGGAGLGGVIVTVGGTATALTPITTLTTGDVGAFALSGLPAPGSYTLTFTYPGYATQTVPVTLNGTSAPPSVSVTMPIALGQISGKVTALVGGTPLIGATIKVTSGNVSQTTTSTQSGGVGPGGYLVTSLPPGVYSVTATMPGYASRTGIVTVNANATTTMDLPLPVGSS
jgi:hypothetical protein